MKAKALPKVVYVHQAEGAICRLRVHTEPSECILVVGDSSQLVGVYELQRMAMVRISKTTTLEPLPKAKRTRKAN
jgi:hypothetical protein